MTGIALGVYVVKVKNSDGQLSNGVDLTITAPPDTILPTIVIISPTNGQTFTTATITVSGTASDNIGVSKVEVKVGSGSWQTASGTTSWSTSVTLAPGSNTIYARATDTSGNPSNEASVTVTYNPPDTIQPTVIITSPTNGQTFTTATITVSGTASDNIGVSKVEVKVGSGSWQTASGTTSWSTSVTLAPGSNTIYARATDTSGNPSNEASITVNFTNAANVSISISDITLKVNKTGTVPIMIKNVTNVASAQIILSYNSSVVHVTGVANSSFDTMFSNIDNATGATAIGAFQIANPGLNGNVKLADVTLKAVGGGGDSTALGLTIITLKDTSNNPIPATTSNGTCSLTAGICGDVNDDGTVDISDAMWLAKNRIGIPGYPINEANSDVNGDGTIDRSLMPCGLQRT